MSVFGLAILGLLCFRLLWGFIGSQTARFSNFLCAPKSVLHNLRDLAQGRSSVQAGHAPIGGYATMAILGVCLFMALSGSFSTDDILYEGPFAHMLPAYNKLAGTLHHFGEKLIFFIIFVHIAALIYYVVRVKKNLIPCYGAWAAQRGDRPRWQTISSPLIFWLYFDVRLHSPFPSRPFITL